MLDESERPRLSDTRNLRSRIESTCTTKKREIKVATYPHAQVNELLDCRDRKLELAEFRDILDCTPNSQMRCITERRAML